MRPSRIIAFASAAGLVLMLTLWLRVPRTAPPEAVTVRTAVPSIEALPAEPSPADDASPSPPEELPDVRTDARRPVIGGPHGRVLESGTDRPIGGLSVHLTFGGKVLAETVTVTDGSFALPEPDRGRRTVEVVSKEWRATPSRYRLDDEQSCGAAELLFRAERIVAAPLRGRLVDARTGEPVPEFLIQARGPREARRSEEERHAGEPVPTFEFPSPPRRVETIVTGPDGRFESAGPFEAGWLDLVLVDHPSSLETRTDLPEETIEHRHLFEAQDDEIEVTIGPTYRLDLALPPGTGVDDFHATFPGDSSGLRELHRAMAGDPGSLMSRFFTGAASPGGLEQEAPLREGEPMWVRFREPVFAMQEIGEDDDDLRLHVRSRDGHWSGSAPVSSVVGVCPGVVPIALEARGAVEGTVLDADGKPIPTAWIQLVAGFASAPTIEEGGADPEGHFAFRWLAAGEYEVVVQTDRYEESRSTVSILEGATEDLEVRLTAAVPLGTVSGVLRSRTGQHRSKGGVVTLRSLEDADLYLFQTVSYRKRQGEYTATFTFESVPLGDYELRLEPLDNLRWETLAMRVSPPAEGLEFLCEDDVPTFDLEFRAIDARTGASIEESWNIVWQGDPLDDVRLDDDWETGLYEGVPEGVPLHWLLRAEGYRLATGDEADLRTVGGHRVVEARLERGWGQVFRITTDQQEPIEGVELIVDGSSIGTTDAQGRISMNLDEKPRALEFRYQDWVVTWGDVDPNGDDFGWGPESPVHLGPGD